MSVDLDLVLLAPRQLRVERSAPCVLSAGELLVQVERVSLCGSDYRLYDGSYGGPRHYPIRFGHEWAGRVVDAPRGSALRPGAAVTGDCSVWCGACGLCAVDRNLCLRIEKFGITCDGFSTRYRAVPERFLYAGWGLPPEALALAEILAVALRGLRAARTPATPSSRALVIGGGALGLSVALGLRHRHGVRRITLIEAQSEKAAYIGRRFPEIERVEAAPQANAPLRSYAAIVEQARHDLVFECSGAAAGLDLALQRAAMGGVIVAFGLGAPAAVQAGLLVAKGLLLQGSIGGTGAFPEAIELLAAVPDIPDRLVTHCFPAQDAQAAFAEAAASPARIKTQLVF